MQNLRVYLSASLAGFCAGCSCSAVTIAPPRVAEGGRALSCQGLSSESSRGGMFQVVRKIEAFLCA